MSRCTTPDFSFPLSPEQELLRYNSPESYPCYTECGWYRSIAGCKALCCCTPKVTPEGDDSPKWSAVVAARTKDPAAFVPFKQPKFEDMKPQVVTPFKDHVPPSSGSTPQGEHSFNHRVHLGMMGVCDYNTQPGVKGWRLESPAFCRIGSGVLGSE